MAMPAMLVCITHVCAHHVFLVPLDIHEPGLSWCVHVLLLDLKLSHSLPKTLNPKPGL